MEQDRLSAEFLSATRLILLGRSGLGKTREAVELIRRIEAEKGEPVVVLLPQGILDVPLQIPPDLPARNLVLLLDNFPSYYTRSYRIQDIDDPKLVDADFRQRLLQTIRCFSEYCRGHDFRVIATAIGEPDFRKKLQIGDPLWADFNLVDLPEISPQRRLDFLGILEVHLDVELTPEAKADLANRSDGTFSGLMVPLLKERAKDKRQITLADVQNYKCMYPQDWERVVYQQVIEPNAYRRNLLVALSVLKQANMTPFKPLVMELASRLCLKHLLFWNRRQVRRALGELSDWVHISGNILSCPDAYLEGKGNLSTLKAKLLDSVVVVARNPTLFYSLRPSLYGLANVLCYELDDLAAALDLYWVILKSDPNSGRAWSNIALINLQLGFHNDALTACQRSLAVFAHPTPWLILASIYEVQHRYEESILACRNAIDLDVSRAYSWTRLGILLGRIDKKEDAMAACKKATQLDPYNPVTWVSLGIAYDRAGRTVDAIDACKRALTIDDKSPISWQTLAVAYSRANLSNEAIQAASRATELAPNSTSAWQILSRTYEGAKNYEEAIRAAEKISQLEPTNAHAWLTLGITLDQSNQPQKALQAFVRATDLDATLSSAWKALGRTATALAACRREAIF